MIALYEHMFKGLKSHSLNFVSTMFDKKGTVSVDARIYVRVSTDEQAREGFSLQAQTERCKAFAVSQGWDVIATYVEDGKSAKNLNRPEMKKLRAEARSGEVVLVYKLDRLVRNVRDLHTLLDEWDLQQVGFRSVTEVYDTTSAMGRLMLTLVGAMAQWERETIAERVYEGQRKKALEGQRNGSRIPYGYERGSDGAIIPSGYASTVKHIYAMVLEGKGVRVITLALNEEGTPSPTGGKWARPVVSYILRQPFYAGLIRWGRVSSGGKQTKARASTSYSLTNGTHQPIVSLEEWQQVQDAIARRRRIAPRHADTNGAYPLTGILYCGVCGGKMSGQGRSKESPGRYVCTNQFQTGRCNMPGRRTHIVETSFVVEAEKYANPSYIATALALSSDDPAAERAEDLRTLIVRRVDLERKIQRWDAAFEEGEISARDRREKIIPLSEQLEAVHERIKMLEAAKPVLPLETIAAHMLRFSTAWNAASPSERKESAHSLFERVVYYPDGHVELIPVGIG